jgi:hypothetical protein
MGFIAGFRAEENHAAEASVAAASVAGAELLAYGTSAETSPAGIIPGSFVGYGAFCWKV